MTDYLVKKFIKDYEKTDDSKVREQYGTLSSIVGICCNVVLFVLKYIVGTMSSSISIVSDAFNNLSDSASCIVTLIGYKLAAKPADKDHPFGHGRIEYLTSLIIAVIIFLVGFELLQSSADKVIHPEKVIFSTAAVIALSASIGVKLWMSFFNKRLGTKINSPIMLAASSDSRNDVIATAAALISLIASLFTDLPADGLMGIVVSAFILKAGFEIIKDTVDELLGKPADKDVVEKIRSLVTEDERIIGIHDLIVHNYGPGKMIASCHAEVNCNEDFIQIHDVIDTIERNISEQMGIMMTIHMDPIDLDDEQVKICSARVKECIELIDKRICMHDFRTVTGESHTNLIFDIVVPYDCTANEADIKRLIDSHLERYDETYYTVITFDRDFSDTLS